MTRNLDLGEPSLCTNPRGCGCFQAGRTDRPSTPVGWSDTDWLKHLEEIRQDQEVYHRGPLPENHVNHWPRMADLFESDPDIPAIGLHCTSVSEDPFRGEYNEETEEYDQPNWADCWSVYDDEAMRVTPNKEVTGAAPADAKPE